MIRQGDLTGNRPPLQVEVDIDSADSGEELWSTYDIDFYSRDSQVFVYPHLCNNRNLPKSGYLQDEEWIYNLADSFNYGFFNMYMDQEIFEEYGSYMSRNENPYWIAQNIQEFIQEHYYYGNNKDYGASIFHPANIKMYLLFDEKPINDNLTCSSSAFVMAGFARYKGVGSRWVGTSRMRYDVDGDGKNDWDFNENGFLDEGEYSIEFPAY